MLKCVLKRRSVQGSVQCKARSCVPGSLTGIMSAACERALLKSGCGLCNGRSGAEGSRELSLALCAIGQELRGPDP